VLSSTAMKTTQRNSTCTNRNGPMKGCHWSLSHCAGVNWLSDLLTCKSKGVNHPAQKNVQFCSSNDKCTGDKYITAVFHNVFTILTYVTVQPKTFVLEKNQPI
jgi:hypothetical protein